MLEYDLAKQLFYVDRDTGTLYWKRRTADLFPEGGHSREHNAAKWNAKFAGRVAGYPDKNGYVQVGVMGKKYKGHRIVYLLVNGDLPKEIDHKDVDPGNNHPSNLRPATRSENSHNRLVQANNKCGLKGVWFDTPRNKWQAQIQNNGKVKCLGRYNCPAAASIAYQLAAIEIAGEFARTF